MDNCALIFAFSDEKTKQWNGTLLKAWNIFFNFA